MKYTVVMSSVAEHQLAETWLNAPDRQHAADVFNRIETLLKRDAHLRGRLHPGGLESSLRAAVFCHLSR
jgi:hypothetical protein